MQFWLFGTAEMSGFRFSVVPRDNYHGMAVRCADGHALCRA
jgi:hypothetical protein